jgi:hypothetical protein
MQTASAFSFSFDVLSPSVHDPQILRLTTEEGQNDSKSESQTQDTCRKSSLQTHFDDFVVLLAKG